MMERNELIKTLLNFKETKGSCYCYIQGVGFYNIAFVLPCLKTEENIILHNGSNFEEGFEIYETISSKEFGNKIKALITYEVLSEMIPLNRDKNVVFETESDFKENSNQIRPYKAF